jgi:hypothetical protein
MKTSYKCINCFFRQIETATSLVPLNKRKKEKIYYLLTKKLLKFDFNQPPVVFGRIIYRTISKISGVEDIFAKEKLKIEDFFNRRISYLEKILEKATDSLYTAAKLSCLGNTVDFGAGKFPNLKKIMSEAKYIRFKINHFNIFKNKLKDAKNILFIADNCGEVFFDRLFMEAILNYNPKTNIFYATRSSPIINDVLISDAKKAGIDKFAKIISSGCDFPGLILSKTSTYFRKIWKESDLVISKGQGNFESLQSNKKIFYIFKIKCVTVSEHLSLPVDSLLFLFNKNMV